MSVEIRVPTLGESVTEATIGQWFKKPGDAVRADEPVVELETDKVTIEVPAPESGVLEAISFQEGETVEVGALIGAISSADGAAPSPTTKDEEQSSEANMASEENKDAAPVDILVPAAGESVVEADVGEWFKKVGDAVAVDEAIVELETDKAAMDVPSPVAGTIIEIVATSGETVEVGAVLARVQPGEGGAAAVAAAAPAPAAEAPKADNGDMPPAPSAAKMMAEKDISAGDVDGSGKRGQILKEDVIAAAASLGTKAVAPAPAAARAPSSADDAVREERVKMTRLRQTIATRLKDAQNTAAMLTTFNEVDMKPVMDLRKSYKDLFEKKHGVKLGFMGFFHKSCCARIERNPSSEC